MAHQPWDRLTRMTFTSGGEQCLVKGCDAHAVLVGDLVPCPDQVPSGGPMVFTLYAVESRCDSGHIVTFPPRD